MAPIVSKPLSYTSQLSILEHMGARLRTGLSVCCPSIQTANKSAKLYIDKLHLLLQDFQLNDTFFEINFVRKCELSKKKLESISNEVDRIRFPGEHSSGRNTDIEDLRKKEKRLDEELKLLEAHVHTEGVEELFSLDAMQLELVSSELLDVRTSLQQIRPLPYTDYLLFSEENAESRDACLLEYTRSASRATEHLIQHIFGGRKTVYVKEMLVGTLDHVSSDMEKKMNGWHMPSIAQQIEKSLSPNYIFEINSLISNSRWLEMELPLYQHVGKLTIFGETKYQNALTLQPKIVHFTRNLAQFLENVKPWIQKRHCDIGTYWSCFFARWEKNLIDDFMNWFPEEIRTMDSPVCIRENPETRNSIFEHRFTVNVTNATEIQIYCKEDHENEGVFGSIVFEVLPADQ